MKRRLLEQAGSVSGGRGDAAGQHAHAEVEKLHAKIGVLTMANDFLSKALGRDR